jgi:hypothetical protein
MTTSGNEAEAETLLASAGIAPKNGWISDYPVTPDILGELQNAVAAAADSNRLSMGKDEALEILERVSADLGLYILADNSGEYKETPQPTTIQYTEPTVINNYYYREGPPVITYYRPPPAYLYLYAWVPYPFWYSRFFFSGFFILHDFHKVSIIQKRVVVTTNHVFHRHHRRFVKVDPVKRRWGRSIRGAAKSYHRRALNRAAAHRGARSILQRSHDRIRSQRRLIHRKVTILQSPHWTRTKIRQQKRAFTGPRGLRSKTSLRHKFQRAFRGSARSFTARGRNKGKPFGHSAARGRDSSETSRKISTSNGHAGARAKTSLRQNFQRAHRNSAKSLRATGVKKERSSSLSGKGKRGFSAGLSKGSKHLSGKASKKLPGTSALKGALKLPF